MRRFAPWAAIAAALMVFVFVVFLEQPGGGDSKSEAAHVATNSPAPITSTATSTPCPGGFVVKLDPNYQGNLYSDGISEMPEEARAQLAQGSKEDPRKLQNLYNASPLGKQPIQNAADIAQVQDGACYSNQGVQWYNDWAAWWKAAKIEPASLPTHGINTGATPGGNGFQEAGAIPPSPGLKVTYYDADGKPATEHWIRVKCGQVVAAREIPGLPPKPPTTTTPPPGCSGVCATTPPPCPPGNTTPSCSPKLGRDGPVAADAIPPQLQGALPPANHPAAPPTAGQPPATRVSPSPPPPATTPRPPTSAPTQPPPPKPTVTATYTPTCPPGSPDPACG